MINSLIDVNSRTIFLQYGWVIDSCWRCLTTHFKRLTGLLRGRLRGQRLHMADNGYGSNTPLTLEADQNVICVQQDEDKGKWGWINVLWESTRRSITMLSLPYPLQLYYRLDSRSGLARLSRGSNWSQRPCVRPRLYRRYRNPEQQLLEDTKPAWSS